MCRRKKSSKQCPGNMKFLQLFWGSQVDLESLRCVLSILGLTFLGWIKLHCIKLCVNDKPPTMKLAFSSFLSWHQFNTLVLFSKVVFFIYAFDFFCISVIVVLAHSPSCRQLLFLDFFIQKELSLFRDFTVILSLPLSYDPAAFFKFKSLGKPFEMLRRQDNILYKGEKATKKRFQNRADTMKRTGKWRPWQEPKDKRQCIKSLISQSANSIKTKGNNL